ncbi:cytochrome P450 [Exidia glandulosa HHB12029]|uniref:Cytochrome P450 n=1 Tax=Exidia glandulosa HHB12029 TaxID=1314781 RepID=A0A165KG83_EXIGL|nr:cytochrome P450 [Exidia glandulosa HHB12029]
MGYHPGWKVLLSPIVPLPVPRLAWITRGATWNWDGQHKPFAEAGTDVLSIASLLPGYVSYFVADPVALKELVSSRTRFVKPIEHYGILSHFGGNIIVSEGQEWKKHRTPVQRSFSEHNNRMVWTESINVALGLFKSEEWSGREVVRINHVIDITLPMALFVIGIAGFGRRVSWAEDTVIAPGHQMTFKEAISIVTEHLVQTVLIPRWALRIVPQWRKIGIAFEEANAYMHEMIRLRREAVVKEERHDLFTGLLEATEKDPGAGNERLSDSELIGNIFVFLVAGHETTAHTLAFALGLLAIYQDEQENIYNHIKQTLSDGRLPTYEDMPKLTYPLAVLNETLRLYPPGLTFMKQSVEDTTLPLATPYKGQHEIVVPARTLFNAAIAGLHYNPKYWEDPYAFKPARFLDPNWPRDCFIPFSSGARSCIGRRFFENEAIALLTMIMSRYKVELTPEVRDRWAHLDDIVERREKIINPTVSLTLVPKALPLLFVRR